MLRCESAYRIEQRRMSWQNRIIIKRERRESWREKRDSRKSSSGGSVARQRAKKVHPFHPSMMHRTRVTPRRRISNLYPSHKMGHDASAPKSELETVNTDCCIREI
jgi:hypothetical protein